MPGLFERGDPPEGYETKSHDIHGASSKVILTTVADDKEYPAEAKPTAFALSAELRGSVLELPMSPDGSTMKQRIAVLEEASNRQQHRNGVISHTLDALGDDQNRARDEANATLSAVQNELLNMLDDTKKDMDLRFANQTEENERTNRKMSALKQESNQLRRKFAAMLMRLQTLEREMEIVPPADEDFTPPGFTGAKERK